jgi:2-polyprenyl-6-hydroxyphenyl methylase/3-demethylubiquinone-9 3-methyltransferase
MSANLIAHSATRSHALEVAAGERFEFGENWRRFLALVGENRIVQAENSLKRWLGVDDLSGRTFLDIGAGSGLFSLAARRLGARVHSLDYDPKSVACTAELRRRYFPGDPHWTVEEGSALDADYLKSLGAFDIVYSWGVLHHTGQMWRALDNAQIPVAGGGKLFIAIYNDAGSQSARWKVIKRTHNSLPTVLQTPFVLVVTAPSVIRSLLMAVVTRQLRAYCRSWIEPIPGRGMSRWRDIVDWVGGYPYEVAKPEEIFDFYRAKGFTLTKMQCGGVGLGCNQFVFERAAPPATAAPPAPK